MPPSPASEDPAGRRRLPRSCWCILICVAREGQMPILHFLRRTASNRDCAPQCRPAAEAKSRCGCLGELSRLQSCVAASGTPGMTKGIAPARTPSALARSCVLPQSAMFGARSKRIRTFGAARGAISCALSRSGIGRKSGSPITGRCAPNSAWSAQGLLARELPWQDGRSAMARMMTRHGAAGPVKLAQPQVTSHPRLRSPVSGRSRAAPSPRS
jgi:hypothetical protein